MGGHLAAVIGGYVLCPNIPNTWPFWVGHVFSQRNSHADISIGPCTPQGARHQCAGMREGGGGSNMSN